MLQLVQQLVLGIGTLTGAITDAKTGYIYDWITYPMILIGLILSISQGQTNNLLYAGIIFLLLFIGYKLGKIGGGDVKLFTAISLLNPYNNAEFLATLILAASVTSMLFYSTYYLIKYFRIGIDLNKNKSNLIKSGALGVILIIYLITIVSYKLISYETGIIILVPFLIGLLFFAFQKEIKKEFFDKKVKISELEEDEIVSENNSQKVKEILKGKELLEEKEIQLLKKNKISEIIVLRNLPRFGPFIFIGTLIAIYSPNLFFLILF